MMNTAVPSVINRRLRELVSGNRMVAEGALAAGCRFFSGYPITPSSEIYQTMMQELAPPAGLAVAAPDEISALAYCVGASMAGYKAMTATSGPGFCLMIETLQYAVMTETPLVVALVQRLGPSTGGATQGAQGDVLLAEFCTSGGYTIPVFAPSSARECYELTRVAFDWSERLRMPVILLSDKEVGMTMESLERSAFPAREPAVRKPFSNGRPFLTYGCDFLDQPPEFAPVGGAARVVATGSAHDSHGRLRKNSPEVVELLIHLQAKVAAVAEEIAIVNVEPAWGADTLVVSYGISARAAREACRKLVKSGYAVSFLQLQTLFPVPAAAIRRAMEGCTRVIVVEENITGLYASVIDPLLRTKTILRVNSVGSMITPEQIISTVVEER